MTLFGHSDLQITNVWWREKGLVYTPDFPLKKADRLKQLTCFYNKITHCCLRKMIPIVVPLSGFSKSTINII